jgi:hypothetical protein
MVFIRKHTYLASPHPLCGDHTLPSPIIPIARWDNGTRSPLAPTVPFSGTHDKQDAENKSLRITLIFHVMLTKQTYTRYNTNLLFYYYY